MLLAPADARKLRVRFNIGSSILQAVQLIEVKVLIQGIEVGASRFAEPGTPTVEYPLHKPYAGPVELTILSSPGYVAPGDDRNLGIAVFAIGLER